MSTKHTPGPWTFALDHTDGAAIVSRTGDDVARVFSLSLEGTENRATSQRETAANAHLIAAGGPNCGQTMSFAERGLM